MTMTDPRLRSLLRQARAVADANKRAAAQQLYREILDEFPEAPQAWLGLATLLDTEAEQREAVERVLALDPGNDRAQALLTAIDGRARADAEPLDETPDDPFADARRYLEEATRREDPGGGGDGVVVGADEKEGSDPETPAEHVHDLEAETEVLFCANHPQRETTLRCNRCGKPVCTQCIRRTPVGYRCKECVREQEDVFFSAEPLHYLIAMAVAAPLAVLAPFLLSLIGFWFLAIFIAPVAGTLVGRAVFYAIGRRRGRYIPYLVAVLMILGAVLVLLLTGNLLTIGIYAFLATSSAFYQLR